MSFKINPESGYVYCIMDKANGICKIGMSESETSRVKGIKTTYPFPTEHEIIQVPNRFEAENYLHRVFHKRREHGEWFKGVSFDEYRTALLNYKNKKKLQYLDNRAFYQFLYDTDCEYVKGTPKKVWHLMSRQHLRIMVLIDTHFCDKELFRAKMDKILEGVILTNQITFVTPYNSDNQFITNYITYKKKINEIQHESFFNGQKNVFNYGNLGEIQRCLQWLGTCSHLIMFCTKERDINRKLSEYSRSKGIKSRTIISDIASNYYPKRKKLKYA